MEPLSEELVDETWQSFEGFSDELAYKEGRKVGASQPGIISFIVEMTEELDEEIRELAIYMFFVVHRMFQRGYGREIGKVTHEEIIRCHTDNEKLMENLGGDYEALFEQIVKMQISEQPYIVRYVVETLFEAGQGAYPILPGEEDMGYLFLIMKTVIDALNMKTDV